MEEGAHSLRHEANNFLLSDTFVTIYSHGRAVSCTSEQGCIKHGRALPGEHPGGLT